MFLGSDRQAAQAVELAAYPAKFDLHIVSLAACVSWLLLTESGSIIQFNTKFKYLWKQPSSFRFSCFNAQS
jgi:hypothetical protein